MPSTNKPFSRREFARRAALGAATAAVFPLHELVPSGAASEAPSMQTAAQNSPQNPAGAPKLSPQSQAEADFRFQAILNQYPDRFSEAQKIGSQAPLRFAQPPLDRIRAYPISNGDLPALYLKPLVDRDKKPSARLRTATKSSVPSPKVWRFSRNKPSAAEALRSDEPCSATKSSTFPPANSPSAFSPKTLSPVDLTKAYLDRSEKLGPKLNAYARLTPEIALAEADSRRKRNQARTLSRAAARHSLRRKGFALRERRAYHLGRKAIRKASFRLRRHRDRTSSPRWRNPDRQSGDDRTGWRNELSFRVCIIAGRGEKPLEHILLDLRIVFRIGSDCRGRTRRLCDWHGNLGLDRLSVGILRCERTSPDLRSRQPLRRDGAGLLHGQNRTAGALRRRLRARFCAIAGHDFKDRGTLGIDKAAFTYSPSLELSAKPLRVGWLTNAWKQLDSHVQKPIHAAESVVRKSFSGTKNAMLPEGPWEDAAGVIIGVEGASAFRELIRSGKVAQLTDPLGQINGYVNEQLGGADYVRALQIREILQQKMTDLFETFDVLVGCVAAHRRNAARNQPGNRSDFSRSAGRHRKSLWAACAFRSLRIHGARNCPSVCSLSQDRQRRRRNPRRANFSAAHRLASQTSESELA